MMKNRLIAVLAAISVLLIVSSVKAAPEAASHVSDRQEIQPMILIGLAVMLIVAKLGGEFFERVGELAVLGEWIGGIVIGNMVLFGFTAAEPLKTNEVIAAIAEIGVVILLF